MLALAHGQLVPGKTLEYLELLPAAVLPLKLLA